MGDESCRQLTTRHWEMCRRAAPSDVSVPSALTCRLMDYRHHEAAGESILPSTVGGRAFPVAGPTICNSLPDNVISAPSASKILKHFCFWPRSLTLSSNPGKLFSTSSGFWSDFITWTTLKIHDWIDWLRLMSPLVCCVDWLQTKRLVQSSQCLAQRHWRDSSSDSIPNCSRRLFP